MAPFLKGAFHTMPECLNLKMVKLVVQGPPTPRLGLMIKASQIKLSMIPLHTLKTFSDRNFLCLTGGALDMHTLLTEKRCKTSDTQCSSFHGDSGVGAAKCAIVIY